MKKVKGASGGTQRRHACSADAPGCDYKQVKECLSVVLVPRILWFPMPGAPPMNCGKLHLVAPDCTGLMGEKGSL
jgi:hypothetical protein